MSIRLIWAVCGGDLFLYFCILMLTYMKDAIIKQYIMENFGILHYYLFEPRFGKTVYFFHMRKQRRRSASL